MVSMVPPSPCRVCGPALTGFDGELLYGTVSRLEQCEGRILGKMLGKFSQHEG